MIAVLVVVVLFVKVLERFGLLEAGYDGKKKAKSFFFFCFRCFISSLCSEQPLVAQL